MSWRILQTADVLNSLTPAEQAQLNNIAGTQSGTLANILADVVGNVQGSVRAGGGQIDQPGTVPDQLRRETIALCRLNFLDSFPSLKVLKTPERVAAAQMAEEKLANVASGKLKIELPQNAQNIPGPSLAIVTPRRGNRMTNWGKIGES